MGMWSRENLRAIVDWLEAAYPLEGCGLLVERADGSFGVHGCENLADRYHALDPVAYPRTGRDFYVLDPVEIVRAEARGERMAVIFHSHPDAGDDFSTDDFAAAVMPRASREEPFLPSYPGTDYLVVSVRRGRAVRAALYAFDAAQGRFVQARVFGEEELQG